MTKLDIEKLLAEIVVAVIEAALPGRGILLRLAWATVKFLFLDKVIASQVHAACVARGMARPE